MNRQDEMQCMMEEAAAHVRREYGSLSSPITKAAAPEVLMLPMPDGGRLRTVIHKPEGRGPFPVILQRSSYPFLEPLHKAHAEEYARRGFAYVYQFCRGVGGSEGIWEPNVNDRPDGKATLDWLNDEAWADAIGWFGSSYLAFTGWVVADILPPKVKTLYLTHYGTDRFLSAYQRGLFCQDVLTGWAMGNAGRPIEADFMASARYRPQVRVDVDIWHAGEIPWYRDWITNTNRSDPYWNGGFWKMLKEIPAKVKVPVYLGESWYDHHLGSALQTWQDLSQESRARSTLRIGAWDHSFQPCLEGRECQNLQNSDTASAYAWFCKLLRDKEAPPGRVLLYNIGSDTWVEKRSCPFPQAKLMEFFLSGEVDSGPCRTLAQTPPPEGSVTYDYDPDDPVPSHGGEALLFHLQEAGSRLQPPPGGRGDVVSFVSSPLAQDKTILGRILVRLFVCSDAADTAFAAKVMEVFPDGRAVNIRGSITTLAYRQDPLGSRMAYKPGEIAEACIDMWDVMYTLRQGSRLRVDISSSDFPQYAVHTNTPGVWSLQEKAVKARQTLFFGGACPSRILIPLE